MEAEVRHILRRSEDPALPRRAISPTDPRALRTARRRGSTAAPRARARTAALRRMIVLDTNMISELMSHEPRRRYRRGLEPAPASLYTSINCAEILFGIRALPQGRRRTALAKRRRRCSMKSSGGRILPFEAAAAPATPRLSSTAGRSAPIEAFDASSRRPLRVAGAAVATRDIGGFEGCGLTLINPWEPP